MTVNETIKNALEPFGVPVTADFSGGNEEEYFTFNYVDGREAVGGDDETIEEVSYMQIHYFLPAAKDYLDNKRKIRRALMKAGATYPSVTVTMEPGNQVRHLIFECEFENEYEMED